MNTNDNRETTALCSMLKQCDDDDDDVFLISLSLYLHQKEEEQNIFSSQTTAQTDALTTNQNYLIVSLSPPPFSGNAGGFISFT